MSRPYLTRTYWDKATSRLVVESISHADCLAPDPENFQIQQDILEMVRKAVREVTGIDNKGEQSDQHASTNLGSKGCSAGERLSEGAEPVARLDGGSAETRSPPRPALGPNPDTFLTDIPPAVPSALPPAPGGQQPRLAKWPGGVLRFGG